MSRTVLIQTVQYADELINIRGRFSTKIAAYQNIECILVNILIRLYLKKNIEVDKTGEVFLTE